MILYIGKSHESFFIEDVGNEFEEGIEVVSHLIDIKDILTPATSKPYNHIVINLSSFVNDVTEICECYRKLKGFVTANIVIYARGYHPTNELIRGLYYAGNNNFILSTTLKAMKDECRKCFNGYYQMEGVPFEETMTTDSKDSSSDLSTSTNLENIRKAQKIKVSIGVSGCCHRIGTTTQAVQLCKYINSSGYKACYIEVNSSGYMKNLMELRGEDEYQYIPDIGLLRMHDVDMFIDPEAISKIKKMDYDFWVYDYGSCGDADFNDVDFFEKNTKVFVCGIKPVEYEGTVKILQQTMPRKDCSYVFSFIDNESDRKDILLMMEDKSDFTVFAPYTGWLFNDTDKTIKKNPYQKLIRIDLTQKQTEKPSLLRKLRKRE